MDVGTSYCTGEGKCGCVAGTLDQLNGLENNMEKNVKMDNTRKKVGKMNGKS